jgi:hypothetical protein
MSRSTRAQRDIRPARVTKLAAEMDLDKIGLPVLNERDAQFFIIDGQHRIEALKQWLGDGWEGQVIECRVYTGLTEKQEADVFDRLNDVLAVNTFDKFKSRLTAGRPDETIVAKILEQEGLRASKNKGPGAVACVGTLLVIFKRSSSAVLQSSLQIIMRAFGDAGMEAPVLDAIARVLDRYGQALELERMRDALAGMRGGVGGVINRAEVLKKQTGNTLPTCIAATMVDVYNVGAPRNKKLPSWWKTMNEGEAQ